MTIVAGLRKQRDDNFGTSSLSELASALGAFGTIQSLSNVDISGEGRPTSTGLYALNQCTGVPSDISSSSFLRLAVIAYQSDRIIYLLQNPNDGASYYRFWSGQWNASWSRNDSFGCNTASELASLLGGLYPGEKTGQIDSLTTTGLYVGNGAPFSGYESLLFVLSHPNSATRCVQIAMCAVAGSSLKIKARVLYLNEWKEWINIIS